MGQSNSIESITHDIILDPNSIQLGKGGFGEVYTHPDYLTYAVKKSNDTNVCAEWKREFAIQKEISQSFLDKYPSLLVKPIAPISFKSEDDICYIVMDRICPPSGDPSDLKNLTNRALHALVGNCSHIKHHVGRGIFIGRAQLKKYIKVDEAAYDLATFIGFVHYALRRDGNDLEYIIGKDCKDGTIKIFVIDFGMVGDFGVKNAALSITAVEYFPIGDECDFRECTEDVKNEEKRLGKIFWKRYISMAKEYGYEKEGKRVMSNILD